MQKKTYKKVLILQCYFHLQTFAYHLEGGTNILGKKKDKVALNHNVKKQELLFKTKFK